MTCCATGRSLLLIVLLYLDMSCRADPFCLWSRFQLVGTRQKNFVGSRSHVFLPESFCSPGWSYAISSRAESTRTCLLLRSIYVERSSSNESYLRGCWRR